MTKVIQGRPMWAPLRAQVAELIRELILEHVSDEVRKAKAGDGSIPFERRVELWLGFVSTHPAVNVGPSEFSDVVNLGLGRVARFKHNRTW